MQHINRAASKPALFEFGCPDLSEGAVPTSRVTWVGSHRLLMVAMKPELPQAFDRLGVTDAATESQNDDEQWTEVRRRKPGR